MQTSTIRVGGAVLDEINRVDEAGDVDALNELEARAWLDSAVS